MERTPAQFLLHHSAHPIQSYRKSLVIHIINAAKLCISLHWGSSHVPPITESLKRIGEIAEMEELTCIAHDSPSKFSLLHK